MPGMLLAPYNDSMRLGQGYNSFLQIPCILGAVNFEKRSLRSARGDPRSISQVVSYSSRFVEKFSEVVKSMNMSAGSSIKSGSVSTPGSPFSLDEAKFVSSDMNAVVSVKVINQTVDMLNNPKFLPPPNPTKSMEFFDIYGDSFISGFIEGGDLHGIVSIKLLDASNKEEVEKVIKGQMNSTDVASEFKLSDKRSLSTSNSALSKTETTIAVNWSGGGQVKDDEAEWSLDLLMRAAGTFPAKVAACPQRTWAILTPYNHLPDFLLWASENHIEIPEFDKAQAYTDDLLNMYMEFKNNLSRVQAALTNPALYVPSDVSGAVPVTVQALTAERKRMKLAMRSIVAEVDKICAAPKDVDKIEADSTIEPPEVWATRLPVLAKAAEQANLWTAQSILEELTKFSLELPAASKPSVEPKQESKVADPAPAPKPTAVPEVQPVQPVEKELPLPCTPEVAASLNSSQKLTILSPESRKLFQDKFRFDRWTGGNGGKDFCDVYSPLPINLTTTSWPRKVEVEWALYAGVLVPGLVRVTYDGGVAATHGTGLTGSLRADGLTMSLGPNEYISSVRLGKKTLSNGVECLSHVALTKTSGNTTSTVKIGDDNTSILFALPSIIDLTGPPGFPVFKGFYGGCGDIIDRLGVIWGTK